MPIAESILVTIIQPEIAWEDKQSNLAHYEDLITRTEGRKEVVVLPEMFSTGFTMDTERWGEGMDGDTIQWMRKVAAAQRIVLTGSAIIKDGDDYYNRLLWMQPDGVCHTYDKRHLFGYADEDAHYRAGGRKLIVQVKGWKICPLICYDLRFPVWARNTPGADYDVLLYVANWPERRSLPWKALLQARAIENQSYCIGVNRVGQDGKGIAYSGDSRVISPLGEVLWDRAGEEAVHTIELSRSLLEETRSHFPFLRDGDRFVIPE